MATADPITREEDPTTDDASSVSAASRTSCCDGFGRPSAPLLSFEPTSDVDSRPPSSPREPSLQDLSHALDPMFVPEAESSGTRLADDELVEPSGSGDDLPPTVRTPRMLTMHWNGAEYAAEPESSSVTVEEGPEPAPEAPGPESERAPDSLRVRGEEADFFRFESFPPVVEDIQEPEPEVDEPAPPSPEQLARRGRLRKGVGAFVALAAILALAAVVIGALSSHEEGPAALAQGASRAAAQPGTPTEPLAATATPVPETSRDPAAGAEQGAADSSASWDTAQLRARAVELLTERRLTEAEEVARALIAADAENAFGYRCLGASLQDQGRWALAHEVYSDCVRTARTGDVGECAALGGQK